MGISRYIWLVLSSLFITSVFAQKKNNTPVVEDEWNKTTSRNFYGVTVYADVAGPITSFFKDSKTDFSFGADVDICHTIFPLFEAGYSKYDATESYNYGGLTQYSNYSYTCNGTYYKIGANFNFLNDGRGKKIIPLLYIGAKFAFSPSQFDIENARYQNVYWNIDKAYSVSGKSFCRWAEFAVGLRYPIAKFFSMGVEGNLREFGKAKDKIINMPDGVLMNVKQSYSPGYGNFNGSNWSVKYTLGYSFH